jgi:hypothetical protein
MRRGDDRLPGRHANLLGWTAGEKHAYVFADDHSARLAGWAFGLLVEEWEPCRALVST